MLAAFFFALPTFVISMVFMMFIDPSDPIRMWLMGEFLPGVCREAILSFLLATPVQFWLGFRFYRGAWKSLVYTRSANVSLFILFIL